MRRKSKYTGLFIKPTVKATDYKPLLNLSNPERTERKVRMPMVIKKIYLGRYGSSIYSGYSKTSKYQLNAFGCKTKLIKGIIFYCRPVKNPEDIFGMKIIIVGPVRKPCRSNRSGLNIYWCIAWNEQHIGKRT